MQFKKHNKIFIGCALLAAAAVVAFVVLQQKYYGQGPLGNSPRDDSPPEEIGQEEEVAPEKPKGPTNKSGIEIPEQVFTYQGEITEKKEDGFVLIVSAIDNAVEEDQVMDIRIDPNTRFVRLVVTMPKTEGEKAQTRTEVITLADLEIGTTVVITTRENVSGRTAFLAESVRSVRGE